MKLPVLLLCSVLLHSVSVLSQEDEAAPGEQEIPAAPRDAQCGKYSLPNCPRDYVPLCGNDGVTYSNECMLCFHNREKNDKVRILKNARCDS